MVVYPILAASLFPLAAWAAVDLKEPCHNGVCQWDISTETGSGALRFVGPQSSISDLTKAAGWTILDCDDSSGQIDIRLACHDPSLCDHLYLNGAENTVVRLPDHCGSHSFAFVVREWDHEDQSIPESKRSALVREDGTLPTVKGISLVRKLEDPEASQHGEVSFFLQASSITGLGSRLLASAHTAAHGISRKRWVSDSTLELRDVHEDILNRDLEVTEGPYKFDESTNGLKELFSYSVSCPIFASQDISLSGGADMGVAGRVNGTISYGVVAAGVLLASNASEFSLFVDLDTDITGLLDLGVNLTGTVSTPTLTLFEIGLPGLDYPNILSIGPTFSVLARANATLDADVEFQVGLAYGINNAHLVFPDNGTQSTGTFGPGDSDLQLSLSPGTTNSAKLAVHLIPTIAVGIDLSIIDTQATANLNIDAQAGLALSLSSSQTSNSTTPLEGCVNITTGLSINIGGDVDLFNLFDAGGEYRLWGDEWQLWGDCWESPSIFGNATTAVATEGLAKRAALLTPAESLGEDDRQPTADASSTSTPLVEGAVRNVQRSPDDGSSSLACPTSLLGAVQQIIQAQTVTGSSLLSLKR